MFYKDKIINFFLFCFIITLSIENLIVIDLFQSQIRFSIVEFFFLILFFFVIFFYHKYFLLSFINFQNFNLFEYTIIIIFFFKLFKYFLGFTNLINLYEVIIWMYMAMIYFLIKFLVFKKKFLEIFIQNALIYLSIFCAMIIYLSFLLYLLGFEIASLWEIKNTLHYPYFGQYSVHFFGFVSGQNQAAFIIIPGYFLFLHNYNKSFFMLIFGLIFFTGTFILIKAKIALLVLGLSIFYFLIINQNYKKFLNKKIIFTLYIITFFIYFLITHFLLLEIDTINEGNRYLYDDYYTNYPFYDIFNYEIYGSLFLKLKIIALDLASRNYYILFNSINILQYEHSFKEYPIGIEVSSEYFSALSNYGIFGLLFFCILIYYYFYDFLKKYNSNNYINKNLSYLIVLCIFSIEGIVADFSHFQQIWIIFGLIAISSKSLPDK